MKNKRNNCARASRKRIRRRKATKQAERELKRLDFIPPASPEFSVIVSYIEIIADLPWNKLSKDNLDLDQAQQVLDRDHYDLEKVKKRLIEYLAVTETESARTRRDPLFSRATRRGQNQSGSIDRRRAGPQICADQPRWNAR